MPTGSDSAAASSNDAVKVEELDAILAAPVPAAHSAPQDSFLLKVELDDTKDPTISWIISVPTSLRIEQLHDVLQITFGWANCEAYFFLIGQILLWNEFKSYLHGRGEGRDRMRMLLDPYRFEHIDQCTLADIHEYPPYKGKVSILYLYDVGNYWSHKITLLGHADPAMKRVMNVPESQQVVCIAGEGCPAAEDCSGPDEWEVLKEVFRTGIDDPKWNHMEWYRNECSKANPNGLKPYKWDIAAVNKKLEQKFQG